MRLVDQAHAKITPMLKPGDIAIDATAGNGHDTLFLAQQVCPNGLVYAIDVQLCAIKATQERIDGHGFSGLVHMHNGSHSDITSWLPPSCFGKISVVMLNLGYLPGGDRQMMTTAQTTTTAISKIYPLMRKGVLCQFFVTAATMVVWKKQLQ